MIRKESEFFQEVKPFDKSLGKTKKINHDYRMCPECNYPITKVKNKYLCTHCKTEIEPNIKE